jgi:hypothetical protein
MVGLLGAVGGVVLFNLFFEWMHRLGGRFDRRRNNRSGVCGGAPEIG